MAKRKRNLHNEDHDHKLLQQQNFQKDRLSPAEAQPPPTEREKPRELLNLQIITGSYDRILHGVIATLPVENLGEGGPSESVLFYDNFLFTAHSSAIRCLALSPSSECTPTGQRVVLASGGTDERINLYSLSTSLSHVPQSKGHQAGSDSRVKLEKPKNKELGSLLHHSSNVNVLHFSSRSKLLSGADDNTIAISRTRDWTVLSTIRVPVPKAVGRPSGDTAPQDGTPAGINDIAVHPSMKVMISVGKGERCMRLWNLVTGKKAGVLSFERNLLNSVNENRFSSGEGRKVVWNSNGDRFVVGFDRGAVVFAMNSKPQGRIVTKTFSKLHQMKFFKLHDSKVELFVTSTEDGKLLFYSLDSTKPPIEYNDDSLVHAYAPIAMLGGRSAGVPGRIKDFEIIPLRKQPSRFLVVTAGSEGSIKIWIVNELELRVAESTIPQSERSSTSTTEKPANGTPVSATIEVERTVGKLLSTYSTENRITCLKAYMLSVSNPTKLEDKDELSANKTRKGDGREWSSDDNEDDGTSENVFEGLD